MSGILGWLVLRPLGVICLIAGAITLPTPLPLGAILIALGIALLVTTSHTARRLLRSARERYPAFDRLLGRVEGRLGRRLGTPLRRTRPVRRRKPASPT